MNLKQYFKTAFIVACSALAVTACVDKDEWETPPINCNNKFDAPTKTLAEVKAMAPSSGYLLIENDLIFDGYIISSDENGNFYKSIVFQDKPENPTAGLQMEVDRSSNYADFPVGMHVRINAKGLRLGLDRGTVKLGSVDPTYNIGRIPSVLLSRYISAVCDGGKADIVTITPTKLANLDLAMQEKNVNTLVTVPNIQFNLEEIYPINKTYINYVAGAGVDTDRKIEDAMGGSAVLRSSGFAKYGSALLPKGSGDLTFVVSKYNNSYQMLIRSLEDVKIPATGTRFDPTPPKGGSEITYETALNETFEGYSGSNQEAFPPYINDPVLGSRYWQLKTFDGNKYIQLSSFNAGGNVDTFFIVPVTFTAGKKFSFDIKVGNDKGKVLKVYTSTDYTPLGDLTQATMNDISASFTIPNGPESGYMNNFVSAGNYTIPAELNGKKGFVMFRYNGNNTLNTTIQLDNIKID